MRKIIYPLLLLFAITLQAQVGINTQNPETTFEVVGKPNDTTHYDGILPPRITGDQLSAKFYSSTKKGAVVFVTSPPTISTGQVTNITETGLYYFDGSLWRSFSNGNEPIEYRIVLTLDSESSSALTQNSTWSAPVNYSGNTNSYLTSLKYYTIGTKNFGGIKGQILFRKVHGIVNVWFQMYRSSDSAPITGNAFISIGNIYSDIGYIPNQVVLLHTENSTQYFPALLENYAIQIPQTSLNAMSTSYYTYGEVQGYSNWIKPYIP